MVALLARILFGDAINPIGWIGLVLGFVGIICLGVPTELLGNWFFDLFYNFLKLNLGLIQSCIMCL